MNQKTPRNSFFLRAASMAESSLQRGILKKNSIDYQGIINGVALSLLGWALTDSNRRPSACKPPKIKWLWVLVTGYCGVRQRVEFFVSLMECCGISIIDSVSFLKVFIEILGSGIFLLFGYLPFFVSRLSCVVAIFSKWKQMKGKDNQCLVYCVLIC